jgi:hypothetical protein
MSESNSLIDGVALWYMVGWICVFIRPYAAKHFTYIMRTLSLCELVGIFLFAPLMLFVYVVCYGEYYFTKHPIKCPIIWRMK